MTCMLGARLWSMTCWQAEYSVAYYRLDQLVDELAAFPTAARMRFIGFVLLGLKSCEAKS